MGDVVILSYSIFWAFIDISLAVTSSICIIPTEDFSSFKPIQLKAPVDPHHGSLSPKQSTDTILRDILMEETSLDAFMLHLAKSYSMEILLSLIEFVQYEKWMNDTLSAVQVDGEKDTNRTNLDLNVDPAVSIEFPSNIIVSEIIENDESELIDAHEWSEEMVQIQRAKIKAHRLYEKYISEEKAGYDINISFVERRRLRLLLQDLDALLASDVDVNELHELFDPCKETMIRYLRDHCMRFQRSEERISTIGTVNHMAVEWILQSRDITKLSVICD